MQQCPKCASSVPDGRTECQICGAPLDPEKSKVAGPTGLQNPMEGPRPLTEDEAQALKPGIPGIDRPGAAQEEPDVLAKQIGGGTGAQQGSVELRRTLSGEVIEVPVSTPVRPGGPMLGRTGPTPPPSPIPAARPGGRPTVPPLRSSGGPVRAGESAASRSSSAGIIVVILLLIVLAAGAGGYWYYLQTRPAAAVRQFIDDVNQHKWGAVYDEIEWPANLKQVVTREMFERVMGLVGANLKVESYEITGSRIEGNSATVTLKSSVSIGNQKQTSTSDINLVKKDGVWKVDAYRGVPRIPGVQPPRIPGLK